MIEDIVFNNWDTIYEKGIAPQNYVGDIFGSLGGTPDFGYVILSLYCVLVLYQLTSLTRPYPYFGEA